MASLPNSKTVTYDEWLRKPEVSDAIEEVVNGEIRIIKDWRIMPFWASRRFGSSRRKASRSRYSI